MLNIGTNDRCRGFRAQRNKFIIPVAKGVHFFFDDIGGFPDAALE
jgi:hypothetical protein